MRQVRVLGARRRRQLSGFPERSVQERTMKVEKLMRAKAVCCPDDATLEAVALTMRSQNSGFIPIVNPRRQVVGVVTSRDVAAALAGNRRPSEVRAVDVMKTP